MISDQIQIKNFFRTDKVVTDLNFNDFSERFMESFPSYVEHIITAWYLRNAKSEGFSAALMPSHMLSMIADFAQNVQVVKRSETAEEYFKRPEIALHGVISGFVSANDGEMFEMSHVTSSDYRYVGLLLQ